MNLFNRSKQLEQAQKDFCLSVIRKRKSKRALTKLQRLKRIKGKLDRIKTEY